MVGLKKKCDKNFKCQNWSEACVVEGRSNPSLWDIFNPLDTVSLTFQNRLWLEWLKKTKTCLWEPDIGVCVSVFLFVCLCLCVCKHITVWSRGSPLMPIIFLSTLHGRWYLNTHSLSLPPTVAQIYFQTHTYTLIHTQGRIHPLDKLKVNKTGLELSWELN